MLSFCFIVYCVALESAVLLKSNLDYALEVVIFYMVMK